MDVRLMRRRSRINLKSAWISAPALLHAGQARLVLGAEPTFQQATTLAALGPILDSAALSRAPLAPPPYWLTGRWHTRTSATLTD